MNEYILTSEQCKYIDLNIENYGESLSVLMDRVAYSLYDSVSNYNPGLTVILCGPGNNGGDGFTLCKILNDRAYSAFCIECFDSSVKRSPLNNKRSSELPDNNIFNFLSKKAIDLIKNADVIVDCIFGTGFKGVLSESIQSLLKIIKNKTVIACDLPSGIDCDSDFVSQGTLRATQTITFQYYKYCFFLKKSKSFCGKIKLIDIGIPEEIILSTNPIANILNKKDVIPLLKQREQYSHKGDFGLVECICGSEQMTGAAILSAKSALASGVGIVNVCIPEQASTPIRVSLPEVLINAERPADSRVIGSGLGKRVINIEQYLSKTVPTVLDADGINYLATNIDNLYDIDLSHTILTPHTVEFSRISHLSIDYIESNRISVACNFAHNNKCLLVLKGHYTIIAFPDGKCFVNVHGNSGLAKGGSGDTLAGYIGGLLAQGYDLQSAALLGVFFHSVSAQYLTENSFEESDVLPGNISEIIGKRKLLLETI